MSSPRRVPALSHLERSRTIALCHALEGPRGASKCGARLGVAGLPQWGSTWSPQATAGLARAGLLDERSHTSSAAEYLAATGYAGGDRYMNERAVVDGDLITAGPQSPVQFARATLGRLRLASDDTRIGAPLRPGRRERVSRGDAGAERVNF
jgi:DJ-1/PfpI family